MAERNLPELRSRLRLDTSDLDKAKTKAEQFTRTFDQKKFSFVDVDTTKLDAFAKKANRVGNTLTRNVTLPVLGAGLAAGKMAFDFDEAFNQMQTLAGVSADEIDGLKDAVKDLAKETGRSPDELAKALYFIRSAGIDGAQALDVLRVSAQAARIGLGDAAQVADAVTSALNTYAGSGLTAIQVTDALAAAVADGKGEAADFAPQLGRLLPVANSLGVSFDQVAGSLSFLTRGGNDASRSASQIEAILRSLVRSSAPQAADTLAKVGLSAEKLRASVRTNGLLATLEDLDTRLGGNSDQLGKVFQDSEALTGVLALLTNSGDDAAKVLEHVGNSTGYLDDAVNKIKGTDTDKFHRDLADLQVQAVDLGEKLLPLMADLADDVSGVINAFESLPRPVQEGLLALLALGAAAGPAAKAVGVTTKAVSLLIKAGVAAKGVDFAGAAKNVGPMAASLGGAGAAAGLLGVAAVAVGTGLYIMSTNADHARHRAEALASTVAQVRDEIDATGKSAAQAFHDTTLLDFVTKNRDQLKSAGVSAADLARAVTGSHDEWVKFLNDLGHGDDQSRGMHNLIRDLAFLRTGFTSARQSASDQKDIEHELGVQHDTTAGQTAGLTDATDALSSSLDEAVQTASDLFDSRQAEAKSAADVVTATQELATARAAAAGDSDEAQQALKAQAEAEADLTKAQSDGRDAVAGLSQARVEAKRRIEELTRAEADARLSAASAAIDVTEAKRTLQEGNFDGPIEQARAELAVKETEQKLIDAKASADQAAKDAAEARRKGVDGSDEVVAAEQRISDTVDAQRAAREKVGETTKAVAKVQTDAAANVKVAEDKLHDAQLAHVQAQADLALKTGDASTANDVLIVGLSALATELDPASPLRKNLLSYIEDLKKLQNPLTTEQINQMFGVGVAGTGGGHPQPLGSTTDDGLTTKTPANLRTPDLPSPSSVQPPSGPASSQPAGTQAHVHTHLTVIGDPDQIAMAKVKQVVASAVTEGLRKAAFG